MIDNIQEFCQIGREVICTELESEKGTPEQLKKAVDFIINEATDYQILSLLIDEKLPKETEDFQHESILVESLNDNCGTEFILEEKSTSYNYDGAIKHLEKELKKTWAKQPEGKYTRDKEQQKKANKIKKNIDMLKAKKAAVQSRGDYPKLAKAVSDETKKKHDEEEARANIANVRKQVQQKRDEKATKTYKTSDGKKKETPKSAPSQPPKKSDGIMSKVVKKVGQLAKSRAGKVIGGLALATMIAYGATKIYKNYFSKAAKACAGQSDKSGCMAKYKAGAVKAQIAKLKSDMGKCSKSKDPGKCKASIQSKITSLQTKLK